MQSRIFRMSLVIAALLFAVGLLNGGTVMDRALVGLALSLPVVVLGAGVAWALNPRG